MDIKKHLYEFFKSLYMIVSIVRLADITKESDNDTSAISTSV